MPVPRIDAAGEKGSAYAFRAPGGKLDMSGSVPVMSVKVADTTGAGDAYLAGVASGGSPRDDRLAPA